MTASQAQEPGSGPAPARRTFDSLNPATGQPSATFPLYSRADAEVAVSRAREAARWWAGLSWAERRSRLLDWKSFLTRHMDELAELMHVETGKPADDATLEIVLAILHVDWAARPARSSFGRTDADLKRTVKLVTLLHGRRGRQARP